MKCLIFSALILVSTPALCDELVIHLRSHHSEGNHNESRTYKDSNNDSVTETRKGFNNNNLGLAYRTDSGYTAGAYWNSQYNISTYAGKSFMFNTYFGVFAGVATGYKEQTGKEILPFVSAMINVPIDNKHSMLLNIVPTTDLKDYVVMNLSLVRKF